MAEQGPLTFDERMKVIETVLADLEASSRQQADVNAAVDHFAAGVGKVITRLRLEIDVARESRDKYRVKRDQLRDELARSSSLPSLSSQRSLSSSAPMSADSTRSSDVQYAALACQPELLDAEVSVSVSPRQQGPFRISSLRSPRPQSPPMQKPKSQPSPVVASPVPAKPSRANKPVAAAPAVIGAASQPPVKPAIASPRSLHPSHAPAKPTKAAKPALNPAAPAIVKAPNAPYVEFVFPGDRDRDRNRNSDSHQTMYGGFDGDGQSEFGEFPPSEADFSE